jgi:hypothetical protein
MTEPTCRERQESWIAASVSGSDLRPGAIDHASSCAECGAWLDALRNVAALLRETEVEPNAERIREAKRDAIDQLISVHSASLTQAPAATLPSGYGRELIRILSWALVPLPLVLFVYWQVFQYGAAVLSAWLPQLALASFGAAALLVASSWLGLVYGAIPFVAHQRVAARFSEETT